MQVYALAMVVAVALLGVPASGNKRSCWCTSFVDNVAGPGLSDHTFRGFLIGCKKIPHKCQSHCHGQAQAALRADSTCTFLRDAGRLSSGKQSFSLQAQKKTSNCGDEFRWTVGQFCCSTVDLSLFLSPQQINVHFGGQKLKTSLVSC